MAKKGKRKKVEEKKDLEQLKKGIEQKGKEIEQLKKTIEEIRTQVQRKEKNGEVAELGKIFDNVSELLDVGFNIFGASGKIQGGESKGKGLIGLVNDLAQLAEKSEIHQKRVKLGEKGVIDFRIRSGPIRRSHATRSTGSLKISKPKKEISLERNPKLPTTGPIEQCEPIIDIFNEKDHIKVMAELPSVEENEINLDIEDNTLTISIDTPKRKYYRKLELPTSVKKDAVESNYRNGILEVKLKKAKNIKRTKKET